MEEKTVRKSTALKIAVIMLSLLLAVAVAALCYVYFSEKECNKECTCNKVVENTTNTGEKDTTSEVNPSVAKLTDAEASDVRTKATNKVSKETYDDLFINGYILDNVFYFDVDDNGVTSLYKLVNVNNPVRARIFNRFGATDMSPTYYVITEDGKVFAVPYYKGEAKIERVFEEYKVKDINDINVECIDKCQGKVILVLQDDTVKEINY